MTVTVEDPGARLLATAREAHREAARVAAGVTERRRLDAMHQLRTIAADLLRNVIGHTETVDMTFHGNADEIVSTIEMPHFEPKAWVALKLSYVDLEVRLIDSAWRLLVVRTCPHCVQPHTSPPMVRSDDLALLGQWLEALEGHCPDAASSDGGAL